MTIFVIAAREPNPELESAIGRAFPGDNHYRFADRVWFVSDTGTAREVSERINVKRGGIAGVVVMPTSSAYFGLASTTLWDWLRARIEASKDG